MTGSRAVNWRKWRHIPEARIWQLVALSLDIDPEKVRHSPDGWMSGKHRFVEPTEFQDRLEITLANVGRRAELAPTLVSMDDPSQSKLRVAGFGRFAISLSWPIPSGFPIAVDVSGWLARDAWSEAEFRDLLCGLEPGSVRETLAQTNDAQEAIRRGVLMGELSAVVAADVTQGDRLYAHHRFFRPREAIRWATSRVGRFPAFPFSPQESPAPGTEVTNYENGRILIRVRQWLERESTRRRMQNDSTADAVAAGLTEASSLITNLLTGNPLAALDLAALESEAARCSALEQKCQMLEQQLGEVRAQAWDGFDDSAPTYPQELDMALQAWRAVSTNQPTGNPVKTEIKAWLSERYPNLLSKEAMERIAIVCNWDKSGGKPSRS